LGNSLIKQAVPSAKDPSDILNLIDCSIIQEQNTNKENVSKHHSYDSMEMACLFYDPKTKILEYSHANRPFVLVRN